MVEPKAMVRQSQRQENPNDIPAVIRALRACRNVLLSISAQVKINGAVYQKTAVIITAIDALAWQLTGRKDYFWSKGSGITEGERKEEAKRAAWERGE
jgi:hypothetical protein